MNALGELVAYNAWANERVFAACRAVRPDATATAVTRPLLDLLRHVTSVEENYLRTMRGEGRVDLRGEDLDALAARSRRLANAYPALLTEIGAEGLERIFHVPWLDLDLSIGQGVLQALVHSVEHRADIATLLTQNGAEAPALDFIVFVRARNRASA